MIYHSTRNKKEKADSKEAILKGLCDDGGLFVSDRLREVSLDLNEISGLSYKETAKKIFSLLLDDYTEEELTAAVESAYTGSFDTESITPLSSIGDDFLLELYHGPTCAFKDVALQMLPQLMSKALKGSGKKILIVTATSGDTGKAALEGFRDVDDIGIIVFYPYKKVSDIQYLQMATQKGKNVEVCAINGNFDDAQSGVKRLFSSNACKKLSASGISLSSANSINIGRLVPQTVYYFESYKRLCHENIIKPGDEVDFCVPTGNFGDVLAGYYAKLMGLPVHSLIVASNENNVLTDFLTTGVYDRNREFRKTISPSMDILISSNLERMLYYISGGDCDLISELMKNLSETGRYEISPELLSKVQEIFKSGYANDRETKEAIRRAYNDTGRLIDPHTAVGYKVMRENKTEGIPCVLLSTASPYKFCRDVYEAIFDEKEKDSAGKDGFYYMEKLSEGTGTAAPESLRSLKSKPVIRKDLIDIEDMGGYILKKAHEDMIF